MSDDYKEIEARATAFATRCTHVVADFVSALSLFFYALLLGPLLLLKGPMLVSKFFAYLRVLLPQGAFTTFVRSFIDWRLGNFERAIAHIENVLALITNPSEEVKDPFKRRQLRQVTGDLLTVLARAYMYVGRIDEGMSVILRAKRILGRNRLPELPYLDVKVAHLVRAGLAAGKLLESEGVATLFVKGPSQFQANDPSPHTKSLKKTRRRALPGGLRGPMQDSQKQGTPPLDELSKESDSIRRELGNLVDGVLPDKLGKILPFRKNVTMISTTPNPNHT